MPNWGAGGAGAVTGAGAGATFGPVGAGVGGILGGIMGLFGGGNKDKNKQISTLTPEQRNFLNQQIGQLQGGQTGQNYGASQDYYNKILSGDPEAYNMFASPYLKNFEEQIIPQISERFAGLGGGLGGGAMGSSGLGQALGGAGAQLQSQLANLYAQLRENAAGQSTNQYNQMSQNVLGTRAFQPAYQKGDTGLLGGAISGLSGGIGQGLGQSYGNRLSNQLGGKRSGIDTGGEGTPSAWTDWGQFGKNLGWG